MAETNDLAELLLRSAEKSDALRAVGLRGLDGVARARQDGLERERARIAARLGEDHPRVQALTARVEHGAARLRDLKVEVARAETVAPEAGATEWILHGYVRFKNGDPAPDMTVSLVDARDRWIEALGFACTDARGYFRIVAQLGKPDTDKESRAAATAPPLANLQVYIRVANKDQVRLYRSADVVAVAPGSVEYREIVLDEKDRGCSPPAEDTTPPKPEGPRKTESTTRPRRRR